METAFLTCVVVNSKDRQTFEAFFFLFLCCHFQPYWFVAHQLNVVNAFYVDVIWWFSFAWVCLLNCFSSFRSYDLNGKLLSYFPQREVGTRVSLSKVLRFGLPRGVTISLHYDRKWKIFPFCSIIPFNDSLIFRLTLCIESLGFMSVRNVGGIPAHLNRVGHSIRMTYTPLPLSCQNKISINISVKYIYLKLKLVRYVRENGSSVLFNIPKCEMDFFCLRDLPKWQFAFASVTWRTKFIFLKLLPTRVDYLLCHFLSLFSQYDV